VSLLGHKVILLGTSELGVHSALQHFVAVRLPDRFNAPFGINRSTMSLFHGAGYRLAIMARGEHALFRRLRELRSAQWSTRAEAERRNATRLSAILTYAHARSPFYRSRWPSFAGADISTADRILRELPLLSKADLQSSMADLEARPRPRRVSRKTTGGSTGEPVTLLKDREGTAAERAAMWLAYGWHGIHFGDRGARFWGTSANRQRKIVSKLSDRVMNRIRFSAFAFSDADLQRYWMQCVRERPRYLHGYVSMLASFAEFLRACDLDGRQLKLKAIIATSEPLTAVQRESMESVFGAPVRGEYGSGEVGSVAFECENATYHVMENHVLLEVLRPDGTRADIGESGEIVLTDLVNRSLPLIRYRVGDNAVMGETCGCGRTLPVLDRIWGRTYDFVEAPDGRRFHGEFFMYLFEDLRQQGVRVRQFQVVQHSKSLLRVSVITELPLDRVEAAIAAGLSEAFRGMQIEVVRVAEILRAPSGKMEVIRNLLASSPMADEVPISSGPVV
jgi:phenylacetate-CoA ligase